MQKEQDYWFSNWFDTSYYHTLYQDRDSEEAASFMRKLMTHLKLPANSQVLDLACGRGRHSMFLNSLGYDVTGIDISESSIAYAKQFENEKLHFELHDMCEALPEKFDAVLNLFTSFGYFITDAGNLRILSAIREELKPDGYGVLDFLNVNYVENNLVPEEIKVIDGITFTISRRIEDGFIVKNIRVDDKEETYDYIERVKAIDLNGFKQYFKAAGLNLKETFGAYDLSRFDESSSERLILIFGR